MSRLEFSLRCVFLCSAALCSPAYSQWAPNGVAVATWSDLDEFPAGVVMTRTGRIVVAYQEIDPNTWISRGCYRQLDEKGVPGRVMRPEGCDYLTKAVSDDADGVWGVGCRITAHDPEHWAICPNRLLNDSTLSSCDPAEWEPDWSQVDPNLAPDGKGGALLAWSERGDFWEEAGFEIQAQRYDASGSPLWGDGGSAVCSDYGDQTLPQIVGDGAEGAVVVWRDNWRGAEYGDLFAGRVDAAGRSMWGSGGVYLHADVGGGPFDAAPDGAGGVICAWCPHESVYPVEICAQKIDGFGDLVWAQGGETVGVSMVLIDPPQVVSDGAGGAIIAWRAVEDRTERTYAQRLDEYGDPVWEEGGVIVSEALCPAPGVPVFRHDPVKRVVYWSGRGDGPPDSEDAAISRSWRFRPDLRIVEDGSGGAVIGWVDGRGADPDIYAQRLDARGRPQWRANGLPVCRAAGIQDRLVATADGSGGVLFAWRDLRAERDRSRHATGDVYAQHFTAEGAIARSDGR